MHSVSVVQALSHSTSGQRIISADLHAPALVRATFLAAQKTCGNASNAQNMLQEVCKLPPERPPLPVLVTFIASADKASSGTHCNSQLFAQYRPIKAMHMVCDQMIA